MARLTIDTEYPRFPVEKKVFGHFTEHAFGNIYGGMYDPASPMADEDGPVEVADQCIRACISKHSVNMLVIK